MRARFHLWNRGVFARTLRLGHYNSYVIWFRRAFDKVHGHEKWGPDVCWDDNAQEYWICWWKQDNYDPSTPEWFWGYQLQDHQMFRQMSLPN